jgi:hypothetical protein
MTKSGVLEKIILLIIGTVAIAAVSILALATLDNSFAAFIRHTSGVTQGFLTCYILFAE